MKTAPLVTSVDAEAAKRKSAHAWRETIESVAIAFVLAFLFRTFVAEAFIIPTGSMSPSLMGAHKDVYCQQCGTRFKVNSSTDEAPQPKLAQAAAGTCPQCRHVMTFDKAIGDAFGDPTLPHDDYRNFWGDRIVVSKYQYSFADPERWDVVVFKYPGDAVQNYIKRLVGLPGETIRLWQGDVHVGPGDATASSPFAIERKPAETVLAMRQLVHDTDHDAAELYRHGLPLRWSSDDADWKVDAEIDGNVVRQTFTAKSTRDAPTWLRYRHRIPNSVVWDVVNVAHDNKEASERLADLADDQVLPAHLINDFNSYNTRIPRDDFAKGRFPKRQPNGGASIPDEPLNSGLHWVGDLLVDAHVQSSSGAGQLWLELVEAGHRFRCSIDLASGDARLGIVPWQAEAAVDGFAPQAKTDCRGTGDHEVLFANVDDQLLVWIDGDLVEFDQPTAYDWNTLLGPKQQLQPRTSAENAGDLAPAAVGVQGADVVVDKLQVYRDVYYVATDQQNVAVLDLPTSILRRLEQSRLAYDWQADPDSWPELTTRQPVDFPLAVDQFFVMGDNSPQSKDARIWSTVRQRGDRPPSNWPGVGEPAGPYLDRHLLIGRAVFVVWPHPWYFIPKTPIPVWPNVGDMRLIR